MSRSGTESQSLTRQVQWCMFPYWCIDFREVFWLSQYKYFKTCSRILSSRIWSSAQDYAVLGLFINMVELLISMWPIWSDRNVLYQSGTSSQRAHQRAIKYFCNVQKLMHASSQVLPWRKKMDLYWESVTPLQRAVYLDCPICCQQHYPSIGPFPPKIPATSAHCKAPCRRAPVSTSLWPRHEIQFVTDHLVSLLGGVLGRRRI